jgi:hypothetical protein
MIFSEGVSILVINAREKPEQLTNNLAISIYDKFRKIFTLKKPYINISINKSSSDSSQQNTWSIYLESSCSRKYCLIKEFYIAHTTTLSAISYFSWILRAPLRAIRYLKHVLSDIYVNSHSTKKVSSFFRAMPQAIFVTIEIFVFFYLAAIFSIFVIRPLRRGSNIVFLLYVLLLIILVLSVTWQSILPPLLTLSSYLTNNLLSIVHDTKVQFDTLFPIFAGIVFGSAFTVLFALIARITRWFIPANIKQDQNSRIYEAPLSYLLDPLYAAKLKSDFEKMILEFNSDSRIQKIFVVADNFGVFLAHEVLSHLNSENISKPIYLLTKNNFVLGGFYASFRNSLWMLVDHIDWSRFSNSTPENISWHHFTIWPTKEYKYRLISTDYHSIPKVSLEPIIVRSFSKTFFRGTDTALIERLIGYIGIES